MPPSTDPIALARRSDDSDNLTGILIPVIVGGLGLIAIATSCIVSFARRNRRVVQPEEYPQVQNRFEYKASDSSGAFDLLLYPSDPWKEAESDYIPPRHYPGPSFHPQHEQNKNTGDSTTVIDEKLSVPPIHFPPIATASAYTPDPRRRSLSPLIIPPPLYAPVSSATRESPYVSAHSDSTESVYSQASAALSRRNTSIIPPIIRRFTQIGQQQDEESATSQADMQTVGKLLKERAKRNPNKIYREVSRIERSGSITSYTLDEDDSGDDSVGPLRPVHSKRSRSKKKVTSLVTVTEGSDTGSPSPSSSRVPVATDRAKEWDTVDFEVPAPPPATHAPAAWTQIQVAPQRPLSFPAFLTTPQN
ncbi:hypothetical protein DXG03_004663 [Asterophora parasitica]|uniref:Uncharacterized protein n=1 Tax=Asterophora parasitica TaxID=117018 RepID=A0A9P7G2I1_9AGAR|nr:hypothetical protein DXG03_004663 [Asterophora parasitica]